jgi:hypothetical protein
MNPRQFLFTVLISSGLLASSSSALRAAGQDDLAAEAHKLMQRARELKEEGRLDESERVAQKAKQLAQQAREVREDQRESPALPGDRRPADQEDRDKEVRDTRLRRPAPERQGREQIGRRIEDLRRQALRRRSAALERQVRRLESAPAPGSPLRDMPQAQERLEHLEHLEHLQQAIRHLHAAGLHEPAERLERAAGQMRRTPEASRQDLRPLAPARALEELRDQVADLRARVNDLQRALDQTREFVKRSLAEDRSKQ